MTFELYAIIGFIIAIIMTIVMMHEDIKQNGHKNVSDMCDRTGDHIGMFFMITLLWGFLLLAGIIWGLGYCVFWLLFHIAKGDWIDVLKNIKKPSIKLPKIKIKKRK